MQTDAPSVTLARRMRELNAVMRSDIITGHAVAASRSTLGWPVFPAFFSTLLLSSVTCLAQVSPATHVANPTSPADLAVLRASGDQVDRGMIRNTCDTVVHPVIAYPTPNVAVKIEEDTSGTCSGSNPPSTLTVLVKTGPVWRLSTATTGSSFRLGPMHAGLPEIVIEYPPSQTDCPVLGWNGKGYDMIHPCAGGRSQ